MKHELSLLLIKCASETSKRTDDPDMKMVEFARSRFVKVFTSCTKKFLSHFSAFVLLESCSLQSMKNIFIFDYGGRGIIDDVEDVGD